MDSSRERTILEMEVSINVLEYFIVINHIMLCSELYTGKVIHAQCDSTSVITWMEKQNK